MATNAHSSTCLWCTQPLNGVLSGSICSQQHAICNRCTINRETVQSKCPCCWYNNGLELFSSQNLCSTCHNQFQPTTQISTCEQAHKRCAGCAPGGCIHCKFLDLRSWTQSSLANLPPDFQQIVEVYHNIERAFENLRAQSTTKTADDCAICMEALDAEFVTLQVCQHKFHQDCITKWFESSGKQSCPTCGHIYGVSKGPQPANGHMNCRFIQTPLPGIVPEPYAPNEGPTIEITYSIPSGVQGPLNPNPGQPYSGTTRTAYLPNTADGRSILELLRRAFTDQHIFTIGRSTTTGRENVVTWNDIHHKTSINGGPEYFGYPDPTYLLRVRQELADKGYR